MIKKVAVVSLLLFFYSSKLSKATLTASTTKAVNVHSFPEIAVSTFSIMLFGKRIHLFVVGGIDGILNFFISCTSIKVYKEYIKEMSKILHNKCNAEKMIICDTLLVKEELKWE